MISNCSLAIGPLRPKGLEVSAAEKAEWVRRFSESGLSLRKFSRQYGLRWVSLWRWTSQYAAGSVGQLQRPEAVDFVEVPWARVAPAQPAWSVELSLTNGKVLRLQGDVPSAVLEQLLRLC
jgi:transposase-like protein